MVLALTGVDIITAEETAANTASGAVVEAGGGFVDDVLAGDGHGGGLLGFWRFFFIWEGRG